MSATTTKPKKKSSDLRTIVNERHLLNDPTHGRHVLLQVIESAKGQYNGIWRVEWPGSIKSNAMNRHVNHPNMIAAINDAGVQCFDWLAVLAKRMTTSTAEGEAIHACFEAISQWREPLAGDKQEAPAVNRPTMPGVESTDDIELSAIIADVANLRLSGVVLQDESNAAPAASAAAAIHWSSAWCMAPRAGRRVS